MITALIAALLLQGTITPQEQWPPVQRDYAEQLTSERKIAYVEWYREGIVISLFTLTNSEDPCASDPCSTITLEYEDAIRGVTLRDSELCSYHVQAYNMEGRRDIRLRRIGSCESDFSGYYANSSGQTESIDEGSGD
jgi:hypothetical protein